MASGSGRPPTVLGDARAKVGESPWWDARRGVLWSVDIQGCALWRSDPVSGMTTTYPMPELTGGVAGVVDGRLVLALQSGLFLFDPDAPGMPEWHSAPEGLPRTHRFNDLTVDAEGRLIVGTMKRSDLGEAEPSGTLYVYDRGTWEVLRDGFYTVNGLAVSPDGGTIYWSDSHPDVSKIWHASYRQGRVGPSRLFVDMHAHRGRPDGAAMDALGGYWIAAVGGSCVHRFLPNGAHDRTIELPVEHPTKPAFGGDALTTLFITSLSARASANRPDLAGSITILDTGLFGNAVSEMILS